jgi:hypothetical protein
MRAWTRALRGARRARRWRMLLEAGLDWLGACLPGLGLLFVAALFLPPSRLASGLLAALALAWCASTLGLRGLRPLLRPMRLADYALWLEQRANLARNELCNALALERERARWEASPISRDLVALSVARAQATLASLPLRSLHGERPLRGPLARGLLGLLPFLLAWGFAPAHFADAGRLILSAGRPVALPALVLTVEPGEAQIGRGEAVTIRARVAGERRPAAVDIELRRPDGPWSRAAMLPETEPAPDAPAVAGAADRYRFAIAALEGDLEYRVHAAWAESPIYRLRVLEPLQAIGYRVLYEAPAYTGIPPRREVAVSGDLTALEGTRVTLGIAHRHPGAGGRLRFANGATLDLRESGDDGLQAAWVLDRAGGYRVELSAPDAPRPWVSDSFRVEIIPDLRPTVRLLSPPQSITMPPDMKIDLDIEGLDDFGLTELALVYGRAADNPVRVTIQRWGAGDTPRETRLRYAWDLEPIALLPGQEMVYYLQVLDNDPLHGPKTGETPLCTIRFPGLAEMYANAEEQRRDEIQSLQETLGSQNDLQKDLEQVAREMKRDERVTWERQQEVEQLVERQEQLAAKVEQIQQSLQQSQQRMENQGLFSMEILEKVRAIQEMVEQVQTKEFRDALERMRKAIESLDRKELNRAMEQMQISQDEIAQALDRTLQMLKRLLANEQLDRLQQKVAELESRQAEVNRQLEAGGENEPQSKRPLDEQERSALSSEQQALKQALAEVKRQLDELAKKNASELPDMQKAIEQLLSQPSSQETPEQMQQAQKSMEQSDRAASLRFGRKAREGLKQMQQSMSQMQTAMDMAQMEAIARSLYGTANRIVDASQRQEALLRAVETLGPRELARQEQEVFEDVAQAGDSLMAVARMTPVIGRTQLRQLGAALGTVERARDAFVDGQRNLGEALLGESMRGLNAAALALLEAAASASQSSCSMSCPSPFNRMQSLSGQQQSLNQDTKQLMGSCQTPRLTQGQQDALMRMAGRQEMIRQGLEEIRGDLDNSGKLMGDAGKMIDEMEEVVKDLQARRADPRVVERQEQILSKLLTAQRSLRKQDETEERRSRAGEDPAQRLSPIAVDEGRSPVEALRRAMLRGSQDPVPGEYRRLVEAYLRSLLQAR